LAACSTLRTLVGVFNLRAGQHARQTMKILSFFVEPSPFITPQKMLSQLPR
jgi:hypothetical protein